jgi:hypothetical protein
MAMGGENRLGIIEYSESVTTIFLMTVFHHVDYDWKKRPLLCQNSTAKFP